jgi:hypothetical protein
MSRREADPRSLIFAGDEDESGQPLPMTPEVLLGRTEKWPLSDNTPEGVAAILARSRQMFVDGYYTYENFMDASARSIQAVEAALRLRFDAKESVSFARLIKRAGAEGLVDEETCEILHAGRELRNRFIHATSAPVLNPAIAARMIGSSHKLIAEIYAN